MVIIISLHGSSFSKTVMNIKPLRTDIVLMHAKYNRAHTVFVVSHFNRFF